MFPPVGRGHVPAACRNYQAYTDLFKPTVCRFAVGLDMSKPYRGCFVYRGAFFARKSKTCYYVLNNLA